MKYFLSPPITFSSDKTGEEGVREHLEDIQRTENQQARKRAKRAGD